VHPWTRDTKHNVYSCTKSVISTLIGIAIEDGFIDGVDQPILDLFPGRIASNLDANKRKMTLEHVLTMSAGLECRDSYLYEWRGLEQMRDSEDWVQFMLDLPMAEEPGSRFEYCNGASHLLSAIIQNTTGLTALEYAQERLFDPLGIADVEWPSSPEGTSIGYSQLQIRPHDMAKIGYLYLNGGQWNGQQVVPAAWVETSTREHISADTLQEGYGYQWWVDIAGTYMALGYGGQYILVVPEEDLVVVTTGRMTGEDFWIPERMLKEFIIPAVKSSARLPPNPNGVASLEANIKTLAEP
jgi:CubicO group peptidase (beta-lactamase class C family)